MHERTHCRIRDPGAFCTNPENTGSEEPQWLPFGRVTNHSAHSALVTNSLNARGEKKEHPYSYGVVEHYRRI